MPNIGHISTSEKEMIEAAKQFIRKMEECEKETTVIFLKDNNLQESDFKNKTVKIIYDKMETITAKEAREIAAEINPNDSIEAYFNSIRIAAQDGKTELTLKNRHPLHPIVKEKLIEAGFIIEEKYLEATLMSILIYW